MSHESAYQTQLKSRRMCLNDTGNFNHVERSPHFNSSTSSARGAWSLRQAEVHSHKANCMEVAAGIGLKRLEKGIIVPLPKLRNYQATSFWDQAQRPINSQSEGLPVSFCTDSQKLCKIREGFEHLNCGILGYCTYSVYLI